MNLKARPFSNGSPNTVKTFSLFLLLTAWLASHAQAVTVSITIPWQGGTTFTTNLNLYVEHLGDTNTVNVSPQSCYRFKGAVSGVTISGPITILPASTTATPAVFQVFIVGPQKEGRVQISGTIERDPACASAGGGGTGGATPPDQGFNVNILQRLPWIKFTDPANGTNLAACTGSTTNLAVQVWLGDATAPSSGTVTFSLAPSNLGSISPGGVALVAGGTAATHFYAASAGNMGTITATASSLKDSGGNSVPNVATNITVNVVKVEFYKADTEDASGNKYGYDDMDTPADSSDDHVAVKKNDFTFVKVKVYGATDGSICQFTSADSTIAEAGSIPVPAPATGFLLKINGKDKDHNETTIQARIGGATGPICGTLKVNVYKEQLVNTWTIYRITDSASAGTSPLTALNAGTVQSSANAIVKKTVLRFANVDLQDKDIHYDLNGNGALEWFYDGGPQTEFGVIQAAALSGDPKIAMVKNVNFAWRLSTNAAAGQAKVKVIGADYLSSWTGRAYTLGSGASAESVTLSSVSGTELTFSANLAHAHSTGEYLIGTFGAGVGTDPQIVEDGSAINTILLHETLHRPNVGNLSDVDNSANIMNYDASGPGHTELRFKPQPKKYTTGNENQWETVPRP